MATTESIISSAASLEERIVAKELGVIAGTQVKGASLDDVKAAIELGVQRTLLENMSLDKMKEAVKLTANRARLEASRNVTLAKCENDCGDRS